jgi:8-oxo-dGTP diphosphatase
VSEAIVAVIRRGDAVLAIQRGPRGPFPGWWSLPSGRIEPGESQPEAVIREMREELGLEVTPLAKVWECPTDDGSFRLNWWTVLPLREPVELRPDPVEVSVARWVSAEEFLALTPSFEGDREFFARVLPGLTRPAAGPR